MHFLIAMIEGCAISPVAHFVRKWAGIDTLIYEAKIIGIGYWHGSPLGAELMPHYGV